MTAFRDSTPKPWLILLLGMASLAGSAPARRPESSVQISFLNVGQGDAILIRSPEGRTALIDAGPGVDLLPELNRLGVDTLDLVVATHPHADHIGGMSGVVRSLPVRYYMDNGEAHTTVTYTGLLETLVGLPDITYLTAAPRHLTLGSVEIEVLPLPPLGVPDHNNRSVGLVVRYGEFSVFLSGDSEVVELAHFLGEGVVPRVTVLKAPHHGSQNGFTQAFLSTVRPSVVVVSVGDNSYGHPSPAALGAYASVATEVYRTDTHGSVTVLGYRDGGYSVSLDSAGTTSLESPGQLGTRIGTNERFSVTDDPRPSLDALALRVFPDAPGNDHQNLNGEYVVIANSSDEPFQIGSWSVCDLVGACFQFPPSASVAPRGQVVVFTGSGRSEGARFYMGNGRAVWNNDGDTATLFDASGNIVVRYRYE